MYGPRGVALSFSTSAESKAATIDTLDRMTWSSQIVDIGVRIEERKECSFKGSTRYSCFYTATARKIKCKKGIEVIVTHS